MNFKNSFSLTALALLLLTALIFSASAKQGKIPIFRPGPKALDATVRKPAEPANAKEVCMRMALAVERWAVDHKGEYPTFFQYVVDAGYIKFPSNKNLLTGKPIQYVQTPGVPGEATYITIQRTKDKAVVGYVMIVYASDPTTLSEDYDFDGNGWPDGVGYCFSEAATVSDEILADRKALKSVGFRMFQSMGDKASTQLTFIDLTKKPVEKVLVDMMDGSKKWITQFKDIKQFGGRPANLLREISGEPRIQLKVGCHDLFMAVMRYATDRKNCPISTRYLIKDGYIENAYINPLTGRPAKEVPFGIWSPGDYYYLHDQGNGIILVMDLFDRNYQSPSLKGPGSKGILVMGMDEGRQPAQSAMEDGAKQSTMVLVYREYKEVGKTHDLTGKVYIGAPNYNVSGGIVH